MKHAPWMATVIVVVRQLVAVLHGNAHDQLGVGLSAWQNAFVYMVIVVAPLVAAALYWTRYVQAGALLLGVSMLAGMTSLWLMLDAPSWYDLQCVTAGVALIGAAYWAVEAYHEMTQTWRAAAAYESLHGDEEESAVPLPIDVVEP